jgi:exodeoxyribonuclease VII large subunit
MPGDHDKPMTDPNETAEEFEHVRKVYTVSELNAVIKSVLEERFPFVWITGEISNFRIPLSGHFYFTLKDETSQISAVMFRGQQRQLKFEPEDGMRITGMGRLSVYEPRGSYQIILEYLEPSGLGGLQIAYEKLKARLAEEGLFDQQYKKPIPFLPFKIALITSPTGAVVHDMLNVINRRFPNMQIEILPVKVQGTGAEDEIIEALEMLNDRTSVDVAILARGGGSLEDLQAFNSERVARSIFASKIPIISAIGHETDYTISDFVADLRAPTPSAAAELAIPIKFELLQRVNDVFADLRYRMGHALGRLRQTLADISKRMIDPRRQIQDRRMRLDDFATRLNRRMLTLLKYKNEQLGWRFNQLASLAFLPRIHSFHKIIEQYDHNILKTFNIIISTKSARLRELSARLEALSPVAILERGYSITRTIPDFKVVFDPKDVSINQKLQVLIAKGTLTCRVKDKSENGPKNIRTIIKTA